MRLDGLGGVDRVQRREDEVARLGRLERGLRRLGVAELADQDRVGVLAQRATQRLAEVLGVEPDLALVDDRARSSWTISIGSSIVTMCDSRVRLTWSTIAASVVVLPEPVAPVTSTSPRRSSASFSTAGGMPSASNPWTSSGSRA